MKTEKHPSWVFHFDDYADQFPIKKHFRGVSCADDTFETVCALLSYARLRKQGKELAILYYAPPYSVDLSSGHDSILLYVCHNVTEAKAVTATVPQSYGLSQCPALGLFIKQKSGVPANIFYSPQQNITLAVLINQGGHTALHLVAALLPQLAPWIFKDSPCTPQELELLKALTLGDYTLLQTQWQQMISSDPFTQGRLAKLLDGFANTAIQGKLVLLEKEYKNKLNELNRILSQAVTLQNSVDELADQQMHFQQCLLNGQGQDDELLRFLQASSQVQAISRVPQGLRLCIHTYIDTVDEDQYDSYIRKANLSIYLTPSGESSYTESDMKSFYKALWEQRRFKLRTWAEFILHPDGSLLLTDNLESHARESTRLAHPHLVAFHCFGSYTMQLNEAARQHDHVAAISIAAGAARTLNLSDGVVGRSFVKNLTQSDCAFLEDEHGSLFTFPQVMELLQKEQEESTHES